MSLDLRWLDALISGDPADEPEVLPSLEAFHSVSATAPVLTPSPELRHRVLAAADAAPLAPFTTRLAALFDLSAARVTALLDTLSDPSSWISFCPGVALIHVEGGPKTLHADVGFVRVEPGDSFPMHRHEGQERVLVLQGELEEEEGPRRGPGAVIVAEAGSAHRVRSVGSVPLIWAVVVYGVEFDPIETSG